MSNLLDEGSGIAALVDQRDGAHVPPGTPEAEIHSVPDIVKYWARVAPEKVALTQAGVSITYEQLDQSSNQIAHALVDSGAAGSHIGYLGKNDMRFFQLWFGANKVNSAIAPLNWRYTVAEITQLIVDAQTPVVVVSHEFLDIAMQARERAEFAFDLIEFTAEDTDDALTAWMRPHPVTAPAVESSESATALLAYTSGTTGRPKGVQLSQAAFRNSFAAANAEPSLQWRDSDVALMVMPAFHLAGSWVNLQALYHGATIAVLPLFDVDSLLRAVVDERPTIICMVPSAIQTLLAHPDSADVDFSSLRRIIYAGSPISVETLERAMELFDCDFVQFYGATELWIITILRSEQHAPDQPGILTSCGTPVKYAEVRVVGPDGRDITDGSVGEFLVRSPTMFTGYWNQPEATAAALVDGGWYRTGDLGRRDEDGYHYIVDRAKDMIISGGENIYSAEVERALGAHPAVAAAAVVGEPDRKWGEMVTAFVVLNAGHQVTEEEMRDHCRTLIANYKVPKRIHFRETLPMTPSGKIQKAVLRKIVAL